jgi:1,4-alpha-glucan branching enzyme
VAALPAGLRNGINYHPTDPTKATLVLLAPKKEFVYVVGDFNNWQVNNAYQMNQTPDGEYFWLELTNLQAQKEFVYQYWVEGTIKIGDPYADKVADPYNDGSIPASVYPNSLQPHPRWHRHGAANRSAGLPVEAPRGGGGPARQGRLSYLRIAAARLPEIAQLPRPNRYPELPQAPGRECH